jgi:phage terminase large subunit-like protein
VSHTDPITQALALLARQRDLQKFTQIDTYFCDDGPYKRELYAKHLEFFSAGATYRERAFIAANRVGKTQAGAYEVTLHLTGLYPAWWTGKRFDHPVIAWASGDTSKTSRDIIQLALYGQFHEPGGGMIPRDTILRTTTKTGIADCLETIYVQHVSGGISEIGLKSYDQQRDSFQGTNRHVIWLDEECPYDIYTECLLRTMVVNGMVMMTATPLLGMSDVMRSFVQPAEEGQSKFHIHATWDDVPHLDAAAKSALLASIPEYQREARSRGIPALGAGAIYPVSEADIVVDDFQIPEHWVRCAAIDVGWNRTACLWLAKDNETGVAYAYSEHYAGQKEPGLHADGIKARGDWIPMVIDPAAQGRSQADGLRLIDIYRGFGLNLSPADNSVESGIYIVWQALATGKLKLFRSLKNLFAELRMYQRDQTGSVIKKNDHLCDCLRYGMVSGIQRATVKPRSTLQFEEEQRMMALRYGENAWMN